MTRAKTRKRGRSRRFVRRAYRRGAATIDYILTLAVILPMSGFVWWAGRRMMNLVYEMVCVLISWPFM